MANKKHNRAFQPRKQDNVLERLRKQMAAEEDVRRRFQSDFLLQVGMDAMLMTAADVFGMGAGRAERTMVTYKEHVEEIMGRLIEDSLNKKTGNGDNQLEYFWESLDKRIHQIVGDRMFMGHKERYDETGMRLFLDLYRRTATQIALDEAVSKWMDAHNATLSQAPANKITETDE